MKKKQKPKIKKLQYPLWFNITFYCLTIIVPLTIVTWTGCASSKPGYKGLFTILVLALLSWSFIKRYLIADKIKRLSDRKVSLEHDYEIEVGNPDKIKYIWFNTEQKLAIVNAINILLIAALVALIAWGIKEGWFKLAGPFAIIGSAYIIAYLIKFVLIVTIKDKLYQDEDEEVEDGEAK